MAYEFDISTQIAYCDLIEDCSFEHLAHNYWAIQIVQTQSPENVPSLIVVKGKKYTVKFLNSYHDFDKQCTVFKSDVHSNLILYYIWNRHVS